MEIDIVEDYHDWMPSVRVRETVARLINGVPPHYKSGLTAVVLTNTAARPTRDKHVHGSYMLGRYHPADRQSGPWIEIFVDRVLSGVEPLWLARFGPMADVLFARPVFHELGHHVDMRTGSGSRDLEGAADVVEARITRAYFRRRYWFALPLVVPLLIGRRLIRKIRRQSSPSLD